MPKFLLEAMYSLCCAALGRVLRKLPVASPQTTYRPPP